MTTPSFGLTVTGSGEVRDKEGNLVNQENDAQEKDA